MEKQAPNSLISAKFFASVRNEIVDLHPTWSEREQNVEFVGRMYGPRLAGHFRDYLEKQLGNEDEEDVCANADDG